MFDYFSNISDTNSWKKNLSYACFNCRSNVKLLIEMIRTPFQHPVFTFVSLTHKNVVKIISFRWSDASPACLRTDIVKKATFLLKSFPGTYSLAVLIREISANQLRSPQKCNSGWVMWLKPRALAAKHREESGSDQLHQHGQEPKGKKILLIWQKLRAQGSPHA